jgi:hypothetical protein
MATGIANTAIGVNAMYVSCQRSQVETMSAVGNSAMSAIDSGSFNIAMGTSAMDSAAGVVGSRATSGIGHELLQGLLDSISGNPTTSASVGIRSGI